MIKKILYIFLFITPALGFSNTYILPFNKENKSLYFLQNTAITKQGVTITKSESILENNISYKYLFVNFFKDLPNYNNNITFVYDSSRNKNVGLFYSNKNYVELKYYGNFTTGIEMDFWIKPFSSNLGQIFSSQYLSDDAQTKHLQVVLINGHINFKFLNLFVSPQDITKLASINLTSKVLINPGTWSHHTLIYNPNTGRITYYINGKMDSETWATSSSLPGGALYVLSLPEESQFFLGRGYRGLMSNFFLSSDITNGVNDQIFNKDQGYIHTRVLELPSVSTISKIDLESILPKDTGYKIEYRTAYIPFSDETPESVIPFIEYNQVHPNKNPFLRGRYIQARITLFTDPVLNESPLIKSFVVNYTPLETPLPPIDLQAVSSNSDLILSFKEIVNKSISSYHIYIGKKPGEYFGDEENGVKSPILVPITSLTKDNATGRLIYTIHSLEAYKMYYMRVSALTADGVESTMSPEISVRLRKLE